MEQTCESMDKNRIQGASTGRAGNLPRSLSAVSKARRAEALLFRNFVQSARFRYALRLPGRLGAHPHEMRVTLRGG